MPSKQKTEDKKAAPKKAAPKAARLSEVVSKLVILEGKADASLEEAAKLHKAFRDELTQQSQFTLTKEKIVEYCTDFDPKNGLSAKQLKEITSGMLKDSKATPGELLIAEALHREIVSRDERATQQRETHQEALLEAINSNAAAHVRVFRSYKAGVHKLAPTPGIWRTVVYGTTGLIIISLVAEGVGYTFGISWCRPSSLIY